MYTSNLLTFVHNFQSTLEDDDLTEGNGPASPDSGVLGSVDEAGNVDMEDPFNTEGGDGCLEAAANKGGITNLLK